MMRVSDSVEGPIDEIPPTQLFWPQELACPLFLASPHSGRAYPSCFLKESRLNHTTLRRSEDFCVDDLYDFAAAMGLPFLAAQFPRSFVDVNRSADEIDPALLFGGEAVFPKTLSKRVANGLGVVPRMVGAGIEIYSEPIGLLAVKQRLQQFHAPYHTTLRDRLTQIQQRFGCVVLLDCHSMPDTVSTRPLGMGKSFDIVLGDRYGASCHRDITDAAEACLSDLGYRVVRNDPYAGGYTTAHYGKPQRGFHSLQIEINRRLYMDERRLRLTDGYEALKSNLRVFVAEMQRVSSGLSRSSGRYMAAE